MYSGLYYFNYCSSVASVQFAGVASCDVYTLCDLLQLFYVCIYAFVFMYQRRIGWRVGSSSLLEVKKYNTNLQLDRIKQFWAQILLHCYTVVWCKCNT